MTTRRSVLGGLGIALPLTASATSGAKAFAAGSADGAGALIVSTWDFGAAANAAAYAKLRAGGSLIDSVEAGAMVPEADPANHSVGYSGYPDRDGQIGRASCRERVSIRV